MAVTSALTGRYLAARRRDGVRALESLTVMISAVKAQLDFVCPPVMDLLETLCADERFRQLTFLPLCMEKCKNATPFPEAWSQSLAQTGSACLLSAQSIERLDAFGRGIGTTDLEGQLSACVMYEKQFAAELEKSRAAYEKNSRLYLPLGMFAGLVAVIIII